MAGWRAVRFCGIEVVIVLKIGVFQKMWDHLEKREKIDLRSTKVVMCLVNFAKWAHICNNNQIFLFFVCRKNAQCAPVSEALHARVSELRFRLESGA